MWQSVTATHHSPSASLSRGSPWSLAPGHLPDLLLLGKETEAQREEEAPGGWVPDYTLGSVSPCRSFSCPLLSSNGDNVSVTRLSGKERSGGQDVLV